MKTIDILQATLVLAFGLLIGSALGIINAPEPNTTTIIKTVSVPGPKVTRTIDRTSDRLPDACLMKFDDLDQGFSYSSKLAARYTVAYYQLKNYDWTQAELAMKNIKKITRRFDKLNADYAEMQTLCHRVALTTVTQ